MSEGETYDYIFVCVCVCVCVWTRGKVFIVSCLIPVLRLVYGYTKYGFHIDTNNHTVPGLCTRTSS